MASGRENYTLLPNRNIFLICVVFCLSLITSVEAFICSSKINVGFAVDGSSKMGKGNFVSVIQFVANASAHLDVDLDKTWMFIAYGNHKIVFKTKSDFVSLSPEGVEFPNASHVHLGSLLNSIRQQLHDNASERGAVSVVILMTAHRSEDDIAVPTVLLKKSAVTIITVGVGSEYSEGQLREIASAPDGNHVMKINSWTELNDNLALHLAQQICQVADRCVSSPCRNNGTCKSFNSGYNCTCSPEFYGTHCEKSRSVEYLSIGCFRDEHGARAIPSLERPNATFLDGDYQTRENAVIKCALEAAEMGYKVFALQDGGACHSGPNSHLTFYKHGSVVCPSQRKGVSFISEVYLLGAKCGDLLRERLIHLSTSTIVGSSYNSSRGIPVLNGSYSWCPEDGDLRPQLTIDLGRETLVTEMYLQGEKDAIHHVDNVCVNVTYQGAGHKVVQENSSCTEFGHRMSGMSGNLIHSLRLFSPVLVRSVVLSPTQPGQCIRTELKGCVTTITDEENTFEGCFMTERRKCCVFPFWYQGRQVYSCIKDNHNQPWCANTDSYDRDQLWDNCQGVASPCDTNPCLNGGICTENLTEWSYQCICNEFFTNDNCQDDYDECYNSLCQNGGTCVNTFGGYKCECNQGYSGKNCQLGCMFNTIELGFLLDSSASVNFRDANNFHEMKDFMKNLTKSFNISSTATRVGVIAFSTNSTLEFNLNQHLSYQEISQAIDNITYYEGGTLTGNALREAVTKLFSNDTVRPNIPKILVIITDGVSTDDVVQPSLEVTQAGIIPYVIGAGDACDLSQLTQMALGKSDHVFLTKFGRLEDIVSGIRGTICRDLDKCAENPCHFGGICNSEDMSCTCQDGFQGPACTEDVEECSSPTVSCGGDNSCTDTFGGHECTCAHIGMYGENCTKDCTAEAIVLFLLDKSGNVQQDNIRLQVEFIISVASTLSYKQIGVVSYSRNAHFVMRPRQNTNFAHFAETLRAFNYSRGREKNLGRALMTAMEEPELTNSSKPVVVIAMIAGKTEDEHAVPAAIFQSTGATILGLSLGSDYSLSQLNLLATKPTEAHILQTNFTELKQFVSTTRNKICQAVNPCSSVQCPSSRICINSYGRHGGYKCITHVCEPNPCEHGGNCTVRGDGSYHCDCPSGIGGQNCTEDTTDECDSRPCVNGGTCRDLLGDFECECPIDYSGKHCELGCVTQKFNLVFVVDGSTSIEYQGQGNFQRSKDFIIEIVRSFNIGKYDTNVAVVLYSEKAQVIFKLDKYYNEEDVVEAIKTMPYPRGGTKTGKALDEVRKDVLNKIKSDRKDLPTVVLVLTDGLSQDDVRKPAEKLRDEGAKIISLGVGCCFDESELNEMATDPDEDHVLEVSFSELDNLRGIVRNRICTAIDFCSSSPCANGGRCVSLLTDFSCDCPVQWQGKDCSIDVDECASQITHCHDGQVCHNFPGDSTCLCQNNRYGENCTSQCQIAKFDVGFLLDSSGSINDAGKYNYQIMKDFIKAIVKSFIVGENDTRIAVATYSSLFNFKMRFAFTTYSSTREIVDAIQGIPYDGGFTFTGYALSLVRRIMIPLARVGVPRILIVLTDGRSYDNVRDSSKALRDEGVHIISVGVGNAVHEQLEDIATDPDSENVFTATFHSAINLVGSILEDVCRVVDHCSTKPCRNSGTCYNELNDYKCTCLDGYTGKSCEVVDHCYTQPCSNGGTCTASEDSFTCQCENGWTGPTCNTDIDECFNNPCINNATGCKNTLGSFECDCQSGYTGTYCQIGMLSNVFDVAFLIDGSSYIGIENFRRTLRFAKAILSFFKVSQQETNVAFSVYASRCIVYFNFQEKYSAHDASEAIDSAPFLNEADLNIENAFSVSKEQIFTSDRAHVPDVLIVFVSSSLSGSLTETPQELRDQGVTIIAVGVGNGYVPGQLETIASKPAPDNVITISFRDMDIREGAVCGAISQAVDSCASYPCWNGGHCIATPSSYTCSCLHGFKGPTCEEDVDECIDDKTPPCDADKTCINTYGSYECICSGNQYGNTCQYSVDTKLDLAFLIDGSQAASKNTFNTFLWFIKSLTVSLDVSEDGTHVGVVVYGDFPKVVINFDDHYNLSSLGRAVSEIEYPASHRSNMGKALLLIPSKLYNSSTARQDAKRVLVILTASICQDNVALPSFELQNDYAVAVFVIGVGNQYSLGQLREIAADPDNDHVITIDSGEQLSLHVSIFRDTLAEGLEPCSSNPCQHGTCKRSEEGYICTCFSGFSGQNCQQVNDPCHPEPCKNNGACKVLGQNSYSCTCSTGWTGLNCDEDIKECSNPLEICHNEGTCYERDGDYSCYCEEGFAGKKCDKVWKEEAIDLAIMIDGSSSINLWEDDNFAEITNATDTLISSFHSPQTRIGLVLFSTQAELKFPFNSTMAKRQGTLTNLSSLPGTRNIGKALNATREHLFNDSRPNAYRVLLCFTHGTSNDDVTIPAKLLHDMNVTVIVIALGDWYDKRQVEKIASDPDSKHLLRVKLSELGSLTWHIQEMILKAVDHCFSHPCKKNGTCTPTVDEHKCICSVGFTGMNCEKDVNECTTSKAPQCDSGKTCINTFGSYQCVCSGDRFGEDCQYRIDTKQDLAFLIDGSQVVTPDTFTSFLYFIKAVTASLNISKQETHVSVGSYGDTPHIEFDFDDYLNHSSLEQTVGDIRHPTGRESNMGEALSLLSSRVYNSSSIRLNVTRVLVVLTASISTDNVSVPSYELRTAQNVVIFAVGVGDQYNTDQLKGLTSDPDSGHVITLRSADDLSLKSAIFKEIMGRALNPCSTDPCHNGTCSTTMDGYICTCYPGFTGMSCKQSLDHCSMTPCHNNGTCHNYGNDYKCTCQPGFTGKNCDGWDLCVVNPCRNNGTCVTYADEYRCNCSSGYTGKNCEELDECLSNPCKNNGTCHSDQDTYNCTCSQGYTGKHCEVEDHCSETPNKNNGTCHNAANDYKCICHPGFTGKDCESWERSSRVDHCSITPCRNNGTCHNDDDNYKCICTPGFTGKDCEGVDHCSMTPCKNNGTCHNDVDEYKCTCLPAYFGKNCEGMDYCAMMPCRNNGTCHNDVDDYRCTCNAGYIGKNCEEVDHCSMTPCRNNGTCHNDGDNYKCICTPGFTGKDCKGVDHCSMTPCRNNGTCHNDVDEYKCTCLPAYTGKNCEGMDYCAMIPCRNNGTCHNDVDDYRCTCNAGYIGKSCEELDHCLRNPCENNGTCHNEADEYICTCLPGYIGENCEEMDHCSMMPCRNNGTCLNDGDEYICTCISGYTGKKCEGIDHCSTMPCRNNGTCYNDGDEYICTCLPGYTGENCEEMDHCSMMPCKNNGTCHNDGDDYICTCPPGYTGKRCDGTDHCSMIPCKNNGTCHNEADEYICTCLPGYTGENCEEMDHCSMMPCKNNGTCHNDGNEYMCTCLSGYTGKNCEGMDHCSMSPCRNDGTCQNDGDNFKCICQPGFSGSTCGEPDHCLKNPCQNNGTCYNDAHEYLCTCPPGYTGKHCEEVDYCSLEPCKNNGSCENDGADYNCSCPPGFKGKDCAVVDYCWSNPCKNTGTCHNSLDDYQCICIPGTTGRNCEDANLCQAQPCKNGGTCTFEDNYFECQCMPGWTGSSCEDDVDECFNNPCLNDALGCENTLGSYECHCSAGFTGIHCQIGILTNMIDIVFLFDGSANMGLDNFHRILDLANNVLSFYSISQNQTNVAAAVYADNVFINFTFTEHYTSSAVSAAIEGLPFLNETTLNITKALYATKADILSTGRDNAPDILVIFASDKLSGDFTGISEELRQQWVTIITVGVGDGYDLDQLKQISTKPAEDYVITTTVQHMDIMEGVACGAVSQAADRCAKSPCRNGGQCSNTGSSYSCSCSTGYTGPTCEQDIDECTDISKPKCNNGTSCVNTRGSYECVCIGSHYGEDCQYKMDTKLDLAFLIDGSQVVTKDNFMGFLFFIKSVTTSLNVNSEETHIGVAIYGDAPKMVIELDQYSNQSSLNAALDGVEYPEDRQSNMGLALSDIGSGFYNTSTTRPKAKRMLVILTASLSQDDVSVPSYQLVTYYHVTIFVIGIGTHYSPGQLNEIVSRPDSDHVISLSSGVELSFFITVFKKTLASALDHCSSEPCQHGRCSNTIEGYSCSCNPGFTGRNCENDIDECAVKTCQPREICINFPGTAFCNCKAGTFNIEELCQGEYTRSVDIGFVVYIGKSTDLHHKGNLRKEIGFVKGLTKTFSVAGNATRVGIVTYSNEAMVKYRFSDLMNQSELEVALDNITLSDNGRNVGKALELARNELFNQSEVGRNASTPKILVVITDGSSDDDLAASSYALKRDNITVFTIGVDRYVRGQLYEMASEPNAKHVFTSVSYDEIGQTMALLKDAIIEAVEPCSTAPCANSATCVDHPGGRYSCLCSVGWTGEHCDVHGTPCTENPHPCNNHGNCSISDSTVTQCTCEPGWNGTSCEDDINECLLSPCLSDGNCTNTPGNYQCQCPMTYTGDDCEISCDYQRINIAFLVDGSASVELSGTGNFNKTLEFVKSFIAGLDVSKQGANVGFAVFSSEYHQGFGFGLFNSSEDAVEAMVNTSYPNRGRNIGNALNHATHELFSHQSLRENISNYLVLLTLGASYDSVKTPARTLREMKVTIFAVGIGKDYDLSELEEITGGNGTQVYETDFGALKNLQKHLKKEICQLENKDKCSSSPCLNGGSCINIGKLFRCECSRGYYGGLCQFGCGFRELGLKLPSTRRIPDSDMTSSSQSSEGRAAYRGRVGIEAMGSWQDGWCSSEEDLSPYIQIFFGYLTNVTVIETEGVTDANTDLWVESFYVSMSNTSAPESFVNYTELGETHIFSANDNIEGKNVTLQGTSAHYIRIHPLKYHGLSACMRIAMYGCDTDDFPSSGVVLQRIDNSPTGKATVFDTRLAVIPVVVFVALMAGSIIFFIRSFRRGKSNRHYSTLQHQQNQESIYQTIPFDIPLYEVQTVTVELGPDQMLEVEGIRASSEATSYALGMNNGFIQNYQNNEYYIEEENYYETVFSSEMSMYEEQTMTIEMTAEETVEVKSIFSQENKIFGFDRQING